jgi:hypothetical protein
LWGNSSLLFAYNFRYKVHCSATQTSQSPADLPILEFWEVTFFDTDRMRTTLPRKARINSDELRDYPWK